MMAFYGINTVWFIATGLVATVAYFVALLIRHRSFYRDLPCPPHSMFWGHLKLMGEYLQQVPDGYTHIALTQMKLDYDLPDVFYLDLWPAGPQFLLCTSPDACAIPTTINNFAMPAFVTEFFAANIGGGFIEATNGAVWKQLHQILAPGLTPTAIKGYTSRIIDQAVTLHHRLLEVAKSGQIIDSRSELGRYPFEVVGAILFGEPFGAQVYEDAKDSVDLQCRINNTHNPIRKRQLQKQLDGCFERMEALTEPRIRARFASLQQEKDLPTKANATNIIDRMLASQIQSGLSLEKDFIKLMMENIKGFIIAGYGTTTDTASYIWILLNAFPEAMKKLREEHDRVFDKSFDKTLAMLRENPALLRELEYTTAVIEEALRLFPVAFGVRSPPPDMETIEYKGRSYPIKGHHFGMVAHTMHYSPEYFDEPKQFRPERFLPANASFPRNAYRPFERGVRACLGQALATDELKIMLLLSARSFDFKLVDHNPVEKPLFSYTDLDTKLGKHAFQTWSFTAGPSGPVKVEIMLAT